jgi:hypothetical protein
MRGSLTILMAAGLFFGVLGAAHAGLEVTRSTTARIKVGATFNDNAILDVPAGGVIELLKKPQNSTHHIAGPYKGTLADYTPPCSWWKAVVGSCKEPAGMREGATRGMRARE